MTRDIFLKLDFIRGCGYPKASSALPPDEREGGRERKLNPQVSLRSSLKLKSRRGQRIGFESLLQLILNCLCREKQLHRKRPRDTSLNIQQPPSQDTHLERRRRGLKLLLSIKQRSETSPDHGAVEAEPKTPMSTCLRLHK